MVGAVSRRGRFPAPHTRVGKRRATAGLTCVGRRRARSRSPRPSRAASAVPMPVRCCPTAGPAAAAPAAAPAAVTADERDAPAPPRPAFLWQRPLPPPSPSSAPQLCSRPSVSTAAQVAATPWAPVAPRAPAGLGQLPQLLLGSLWPLLDRPQRFVSHSRSGLTGGGGFVVFWRGPEPAQGCRA